MMVLKRTYSILMSWRHNIMIINKLQMKEKKDISAILYTILMVVVFMIGK